MSKKWWVGFLLVLTLTLGGGIFLVAQSSPGTVKSVQTEVLSTLPTNMPTPTFTKSEAPLMEIDTAKTYSAVLTTTEGKIEIQFTAKETPITVNNFVHLARTKFYDGTIFHRVIKGFMIQGGDPLGIGTGGPGYKFADEPFSGEYKRGTVAMANAGPDTNGSQFFIMHQDTPLSHDYVIFGQVTAGMDVVDKIASAPTGANDRPVTPVAITSVVISEK